MKTEAIGPAGRTLEAAVFLPGDTVAVRGQSAPGSVLYVTLDGYVGVRLWGESGYYEWPLDMVNPVTVRIQMQGSPDGYREYEPRR